eukprot:COSAG01_NODE_53834_length_336_cov_0.873418_1_plen_50_part_00
MDQGFAAAAAIEALLPPGGGIEYSGAIVVRPAAALCGHVMCVCLHTPAT